MIKLLQTTKYKVDFAEFAVAWLFPIGQIMQNLQGLTLRGTREFWQFYHWVYRNLKNQRKVRKFCVVLDKGQQIVQILCNSL